jgi:hypothetical protein
MTLLLLLESSALSQDAHFTVNNTADFSLFKTYKWVTFKNVAPIDDLTDEQIKAAVDAALAKKGLTKVDVDTADLFIGYQSSELITRDLPTAWNESPPTIYHGDLAIDMYTPANHDLVWRGVASKTLDPKANPEKHQKNLNKALAKLMKNYPPSK